jgi:hypothetical protein
LVEVFDVVAAPPLPGVRYAQSFTQEERAA